MSGIFATDPLSPSGIFKTPRAPKRDLGPTTLGPSAGCPRDFENPLGLRGICAKIPSKKPESPIQVLVTRVGYLHPMTGGFPDSYPPVLGCDILSYNPHFDIIPHLRGISNFGKKYRPQILNF